MKRIVVDLDNTITQESEEPYENKPINIELVERLKDYQELGFQIVIYTSRNMRTHNGNVGKINLHTIPIITDWLQKNGIPCDELIVGKPWCGFDGFYIDDKAVRPNEFCSLEYHEIQNLIGKE